MPRSTDRSSLALAGVAALAGAAICAEIGWRHMRGLAAAYGTICGSAGAPHCAACGAAAGLLAAGLMLAAAAARRPAPVRSPAR